MLSEMRLCSWYYKILLICMSFSRRNCWSRQSHGTHLAAYGQSVLAE
jgi:hypothetical protein